jgi:hypothetical protein
MVNEKKSERIRNFPFESFEDFRYAYLNNIARVSIVSDFTRKYWSPKKNMNIFFYNIFTSLCLSSFISLSLILSIYIIIAKSWLFLLLIPILLNSPYYYNSHRRSYRLRQLQSRSFRIICLVHRVLPFVFFIFGIFMNSILIFFSIAMFVIWIFPKIPNFIARKSIYYRIKNDRIYLIELWETEALKIHVKSETGTKIFHVSIENKDRPVSYFDKLT